MTKKLTATEEGPEITLLGDQFGIRIQKRGQGDNHALLVLLAEDDESWYETDSFSSYWLDDLIETLKNAKFILETSSKFEDDKDGYGKQWKD